MNRDQILKAIISGTTANIQNIGDYGPILEIQKVKSNEAATITWRHATRETGDQVWTFHPKATYMIGALGVGSDEHRRFTIGSVHVDDRSQLSIDVEPTGNSDTGELLSDVFNRCSEPLWIKWESGSQDIKIRVFNINEEDIYVFICIWCKVEIREK